MTVIYGDRSTENVLQSNVWEDIADVVYNLWPNETPFLTFTANMRKRQAFNPKFDWFSKEPRADADLVNDPAGYTPGDTQIIVENIEKFLAGDMLRHISAADGSFKEVMRVISVDVGTSTLTVLRGVGNTTPDNIADNDTLLIIGDAQPEGSDIPPGNAQKLAERFNYTQIFRTSTTYTRTLAQTRLKRDAEEVKRRREEKTREHKRKLEKAFLWGERGIEGAGTDSPNRKTAGIYSWLQTSQAEGIDNVQNQGAGTISEAQFEQFLEEKVFVYGAKEKLLIASPRVISVLNNLVRGRIEVVNMAKEFGINIVTWASPHGVLKVMRHELFNHGVFKYAGLVLDPSQISMRFIGDSEMQFRSDIGVEGKDSFTDDWLSEVGLEVGTPANMALLTNVQNAA